MLRRRADAAAGSCGRLALALTGSTPRGPVAGARIADDYVSITSGLAANTTETTATFSFTTVRTAYATCPARRCGGGDLHVTRLVFRHRGRPAPLSRPRLREQGRHRRAGCALVDGRGTCATAAGATATAGATAPAPAATATGPPPPPPPSAVLVAPSNAAPGALVVLEQPVARRRSSPSTSTATAASRRSAAATGRLSPSSARPAPMPSP